MTDKMEPSETRIALVGIVVENPGSVEALNQILHDYRAYIVGRMGIPYREKGISIISVALDAPQPVISALAGKVGRLDGVSSKTIYARQTGRQTGIQTRI